MLLIRRFCAGALLARETPRPASGLRRPARARDRCTDMSRELCVWRRSPPKARLRTVPAMSPADRPRLGDDRCGGGAEPGGGRGGRGCAKGVARRSRARRDDDDPVGDPVPVTIMVGISVGGSGEDWVGLMSFLRRTGWCWVWSSESPPPIPAPVSSHHGVDCRRRSSRRSRAADRRFGAE